MTTIRLGALQVDPSRNLITNDAASWSIEPRIMDLLVLLAAHPGEVMSREALIEQVWKVEYGADESLTRAISQLRKTFRDAGETAELIETIPKRGYRLTVAPEPVSPGRPGPLPAAAPPATLNAVNAPASGAVMAPEIDAPVPTVPKPADPRPAARPQPPPASRQAASKTGLRRFVPLAGVVVAALLLVAVAVFALRPPSSPPEAEATSQLIAFFEFTPTGDDPSVKATAEAATDRIFQSMGGWKNLLSTVARTETRGTPDNVRFARAAELGARYVLGGEMRPDADGMTLSVRFEDVSSRLTLWEKSFSAPASDVAYLPAPAAMETAFTMWCIVKTRAEATRDTTAILNLIADRCRLGASADQRNGSYIISRMRAITEADPGSAYNLAQLVAVLSLGASVAPPSARAEGIAEAEDVLQRATKLDPDELNLLWGRIALDTVKGVSVSEFEAMVLDAAAKSEGKDAFVFGIANHNRALIFQTSGRFRDALPHIEVAVAHQTTLVPWAAGPYHAALGRRAQARAEIEPAVAAYGAWAWTPMIPYAIFLDAADADAMLASPPSAIPKPTVDCLRDIQQALASNDTSARARGATQARECGAAEVISPLTVLASLAALDDLDAAFEQADSQTFNSSTLESGGLQALFWPASRDMRADPRFLPLVEKLGMMDYWRTTRSQPDVCETEAAPFCAALKTANAQP